MVLISREVYTKVGNLNPIFHHAVGDFDYSMGAKKLGIELFVEPHFIGICESHDTLPKWRDGSLTVIKRIKNLYSASRGCYPTEFFVFDRRHNGVLVACFHYFTIHLRAIIPSFWQLKFIK